MNFIRHLMDEDKFTSPRKEANQQDLRPKPQNNHTFLYLKPLDFRSEICSQLLDIVRLSGK